MKKLGDTIQGIINDYQYWNVYLTFYYTKT